MTVSRYRVVEPNQPHFLTCTVVGWLPVFTRPEAVQIVLDSWRYLHDNRQLVLSGYVILENHVHFIARAPDLARAVQDFKSFTAHKLIALLQERHADTLLRQLHDNRSASRADRPNQLWIEGSHPQWIQNEEMMIQKLEYIHYNPVKRGYVDDPIHWRYSSARNYAGMPGLIPVDTTWMR